MVIMKVRLFLEFNIVFLCVTGSMRSHSRLELDQFPRDVKLNRQVLAFSPEQ